MDENRVYILDTTLRDGEQTPGVNLNVAEKTNIALQLELLGVDIIEAGFANASPGDFDAVCEVAKSLKRATTCSLARCNEVDIRAAGKALRFAHKPRIHTFIATSDIHMQYKLKMTPERVLQRVIESVRLARTLCDEVQFSPEDGSRTRPEFLVQVLEAAIEEGASIINIPDTVGYSTVREFGDLMTFIKENVHGIDNVILGAHCHDDLGLAVANSLEAIRCGARQVECTINGMGERAGNAALEEIVMGLYTRKDYYGCTTGIDTKQIHRTSRLVSRMTNTDPSPGKAVIGANAFLHESGIHQHGVLNNRATYEVMKAEDLGMIAPGVVLGKLSGKHAFSERATALGYRLTESELDTAFMKFKLMADRKRIVTDRDIDALMGDQIIEVPEIYHMTNFQVYANNKMQATATITLLRDGVEKTEAAVGNGPVEASFTAIDKISGMELELVKYRVRAASEGRDALGEVTVRVAYGDKSATGRGISTDVVEASVLAYVSGLNRIISDI
ncbi:2-isopropylmalate synthase [Christensenellaceae bacterium OttesenSCG-928-L17]|nr:2-isopropylmalate synthase [Christensenellaceae bacterium OttesenSCG-928-L17]